MMNKKLVALLGSPHKDGATAKMAAKLSAAFSEQGWECQTIHIYDAELEPCRGCMVCRDTGECVIKDGIGPIRDSLISCNLAILAAPVYFANVPGPVKTLFDRLSGAVVDRKAKPRLKKTQQYILLSACSTPAPFDCLAGQSSGALRAMKGFFRMAGMTCRGKVVYPGAVICDELPENILNSLRRLMP